MKASNACRLAKCRLPALLAAALAATAAGWSGVAAQSLEEVVVTASRLETPLGQTLSDVTVIDRARIEQAGAATLAQLLRAAADVEISENGGAGNLTGIFVRGTKTAQTVVLVDGIRLENPLAGGANLEFLPLGAIDRIEVLRGPASSLYGSGAIGGVIQIFTQRGQGPLRAFGSIGGGTYSSWELRGGVAGGSQHTRVAASASLDRTRGFDATRPGATDRQADADGNRSGSATFTLSQKLSGRAEVGITALASSGAARFDSAYSAPEQTRYDYRTQNWSVYALLQPHPDWKATLRLGRGAIAFDFQPFVYAPDMRSLDASWQNEIRLGAGRLLLGLEWLRQRVSGAGVAYVVDGIARDELTRLTRSAFVGYDLLGPTHSLRAHLRYDDIDAVGSRVSGSFAYGYRLAAAWQLRGSVGTAFRAPTFDDLFSPFGANPSLRPERMTGVELALERMGLATGFRATLFGHQIRDAIELDTSFVPQNLARATVRGLTLEGTHTVGAWNLGARVTFQDPRGERDAAAGSSQSVQLARRSRVRAAMTIEYRRAHWSVAAELLAQGHRVDADGSTMGGYGVLDLRAARELGGGAELFLRIGNLADKEYETAAGYATAGRMVFVGLRYAPR